MPVILQSFSKYVLLLIVCIVSLIPLAAQDNAADPYAEALHRIEEVETTGVTKLDLSSLKLEALPPEIGQLTNLTELDLSGNQLTSLPPEIGKLTELVALFLQGNQLTSLPPEIGKLTKLDLLELSANRLTTLPPEIGKLTMLHRLDLTDNQLTSLPPEIGKLTKLISFTIGNNQLTTLPLEMGELHAFQTILDGNPLTFPPSDVQAQGPGAVLAYLHDYNAMQLRQSLIMIVVVSIAIVGLVFAWRRLQNQKKKFL
jgi:internalin A